MEKFLEIIKLELADTHSTIDENTKFKELEEWDSLTGMSLVVLLEETYGVSIPDEIFKSFNTLGDIFAYIKEKKCVNI
ncbi:acyl carrier protein [Arcticibacter svalbardensis]|uniref:acyl carrier protein n=1 Tax=Arcticibacter svalbardensis TaxID=1288027 RepID=UPI00058C2BEF|nr:acyl carrier protein [Arcticibacter svalbardensis]